MEILGSSSQDSAQSGCIGLSGGAPDSVRCARLALVSRELDGGVRLKITGLSGEPTVGRANGRPSQRSAEPTVGRANGRPRNPRVTRGRANSLKGAPDCPVCTG
jgi:hypothetical protein